MDKTLKKMAVQGKTRDEIRAELKVSDFVIRREALRLGVKIRRATKAKGSKQTLIPLPQPPKYHPDRSPVPERSVFDIARDWLEGEGFTRTQIEKMTLGERLDAYRGRKL